MISNLDYQSTYEKFYKQMKKYIWDIDVIMKLADFETALYRSFPDIDEVKDKFKRLEPLIRPVYEEDEEFEDAIKSLEDVVNSDESTYVPIIRV